MKKRILSILLVLIMVFSMLPMTALAAEEEPVTPVNTPSVSTPDSSAVQIVKSVSEVNNDGTYTLSMDAYVTGDVVTTNPDPLDIVLVLDVSGSMKDDISIVTSSTYVKSNTTNAIAYLLYNYNDQAYFYLDDGTYYPVTQFWHEDGLIFGTYYCSYEKDGVITTVELGSSIDTTKLYYVTAVQTTISKMDALKNAVNSFIAKTAEKNAAITDDSAKHRISIVKFAGKSTNEIGNDMYKDRDYNYNYSQIVTELTTVDDAGAAALKAEVNKITPAGATSADYGLEHANTVLSDSTRSKVVIFFTDGEPNHGNGFDNGVANDAIKEAKKLKDARATVYTIGVFANADPTDTTRNVNKFMHAVSSNYPTAESLNNMGNRTPGSDYYKTANSEEALTKIFGDIADEMVPDVEAGSNSILTDTVSGYFTAPEVAADVTVEVYQASGNGVAPVWTKDETFDTTGIIASVESQNISVTGFDYSANAVVQDAAGNWTGKKLVISFDITPNPNATWSAGTNEYPTNVAGENNEANAGLAYGNDKTELTESPTVLITAYTVEYAYDGTVPEGARTLPAVGVYLPGTEVAVAAAPELDGYTFDGWYLNGEKVTSFTMPAENVTLTGTWSQNEYTVSYDYGTAPAGASALPATATYHYGDTVTVADAATAPGYTFNGWYLNGEKVTSFTMPAENVTLTGTWSLIPVPGLTVTKTANDEKASVGDTISWNITVKNTGNVDLTGITLTDTLKAAGDVTLYDANGRALPAGYTFSLGKGEEVKFTAKYKVTSADAGKTICNTIVAAVPGGPSGEDTSEGTQIRPIFPVVPVLPVLNTEDHVAYIIGYADDTVRPENNITRAEVATIFFRLLTDSSREFYWTQKNDYSDVNRGDWFNNAVSTLSNAGIITGYPDGTFRPNAPITRAEFAAIAARFSDVAYSGKNTFSDVPDTHWAARCITLAEHLGWVAGYPDGTFRPNKAITRAEAMTLINRVLERAVDEKHMLPNMVTWSDNKPGAWYYEAVQEATNSHEYTRLTSRVSKLDFFYENWTKILPVPDWAALEKTWSDASSK